MSHDWSSHLTPGERVVWEGRPDTGLFVFRAYDGFLIPFAVFFGIVAVGVILVGALNDVVFLAVGVIFALTALYMGVGRFFVSQSRRKRSRYALTDRRALITEGAGAAKGMALVPDLPIIQRGDRVTFGKPVPAFTNRSSAAAFAGGDADFTFVGLEDAQAVHEMADRIKAGEAA